MLQVERSLSSSGPDALIQRPLHYPICIPLLGETPRADGQSEQYSHRSEFTPGNGLLVQSSTVRAFFFTCAARFSSRLSSCNSSWLLPSSELSYGN